MRVVRPYDVGIDEKRHGRVVAYSVAVLATVISLLVRWPLWPLLGHAVPHMTFFPAVMIAAYFGGFGPGLLATILSAAAANFFFTGQLRSLRITDANDLAAVILFVVVGTMISGLSESLHRTRRRYRDLVNSVEGIVWEAAAATLSFVFVSDHAERVLGYPVEQWLSEPTFWKDHLHPEDREWAVQFCQKAIHDRRRDDFECRLIAADGRIVWVRNLVNVVTEPDRAARVRGVMFDITEQRRAEEALREAQANLARVTRVTTVGELTASLAHEIKQPIAAAITNANTCLRWLRRDEPELEEAREAASRMVKDATRASAAYHTRVSDTYTKA